MCITSKDKTLMGYSNEDFRLWVIFCLENRPRMSKNTINHLGIDGLTTDMTEVKMP